jgi:hypothetical protein
MMLSNVEDSSREKSYPWLNRTVSVALAVLYVVAWGVGGFLVTITTDLDAFFLPSARIALAGHPLLVYAVRFKTLYPNANGPLSLIPLTAVARLGAELGWLDDIRLRHMLVMAAFSVFALLMAREGTIAVERLRGAKLRGIWRVLVYGIFAASPTLWHGVLFYGHIEQPIAIGLTLFSVRALSEGKPGRAGLSLGLAILARSMVVVYIVPLVVLLIANHRRSAAAWFGGIAVITVMLGLLPFYLADSRDVVFSLATFRATLPVGGGSILRLTVGTPYESLAQHSDIVFAAAAVLLVSLIGVHARHKLEPGGRDVYGLLALAGTCFTILMKTVWPYYFVDLQILAVVWWLGEPGSWTWKRCWLGMLLPAFFSGCALLAEYWADVVDTAARYRESLVMSVLLAFFVLAFGAWLFRSKGELLPLCEVEREHDRLLTSAQ